jgi:hypothetical protein
LVGTNNTYTRIRFRKFHHLPETIRHDEIIAGNDFAVLRGRGDQAECMIVIRNDWEKIIVIVDANPAVFLRVALRNFQRSILAAVIHDQVFKI